MQWQHKGFCFKMNQLIYSSEHTNVKQAQCLMFLSALCCTWLLPNTETTNHSNVKFVTEISSCRISNVSDCTHANRMFLCCVYGQRWWWYSRLPAVHSPENISSSSACQASSLGRAVRPSVCMVGRPSTRTDQAALSCPETLLQRSCRSVSEEGLQQPKKLTKLCLRRKLQITVPVFVPLLLTVGHPNQQQANLSFMLYINSNNS